MLKFVILLSLTVLPLFSRATPLAAADTQASFLCTSVLQQKPYVYAEHFAPAFIAQIPEDYFHQLMKNVSDTTGLCVKFTQTEFLPKGVRYNFLSAKGDFSTLDVSWDDKGLISGLLIHGVSLPSIVLKNWDDVKKHLAGLEGSISVSIQTEITQPHSYAPQIIHPIGSAFKLYVLGDLSDSILAGEKTWTQTFPITDAWKSLPSGIMQDWPAGKMVSLQEYAEWMIKISDNTATDHLINILGRDKVEKQLSLMGNSVITKNTPFLKTSDMFRLKWGVPPDLTQEYLKGDANARRAILDSRLPAIPLSQVGTNGVSMEKPTLINDLEWFASTDDLCTAMASLQAKGSPQVLDILSKNTPIISVTPDSKWSYVGFKGGSEPGVMTMSFLLQAKTGNHGCVSVAWHNTEKEINEFVMLDLVQKILKISESYF